ncbi:MAG: accessory gene regulator B family protein [Clostridiales bacterium]|nr:accessory gene regulator B family protein [Clostridiales bacterium]
MVSLIAFASLRYFGGGVHLSTCYRCLSGHLSVFGPGQTGHHRRLVTAHMRSNSRDIIRLP